MAVWEDRPGAELAEHRGEGPTMVNSSMKPMGMGRRPPSTSLVMMKAKSVVPIWPSSLPLMMKGPLAGTFSRPSIRHDKAGVDKQHQRNYAR